MICPICKTDITAQEKQYGDIGREICLSCWLAGDAWIVEDDFIFDALKRGMSLEDAMDFSYIENEKNINKFFSEWSFPL